MGAERTSSLFEREPARAQHVATHGYAQGEAAPSNASHEEQIDREAAEQDTEREGQPDVSSDAGLDGESVNPQDQTPVSQGEKAKELEPQDETPVS